MLAYLSVKGFAIIDELRVEFGEGFNVITGETGAGKSIIINALSTLMNTKVSADVVRSGATQAEITGHFINKNEEYILKRVVASTGRSRAFLNDEPVTLTKLESIGGMQISIYGQNEFQHLLDKENYVGIIDNLLSLTEEQKALAEKVDALKKIGALLDHKKSEAQGRQREIELMEFQIDEIEKKNVQQGEEEAIRERLKVLKSAEKISNVLEEIGQGLRDGDNSAQALLKRSMSLLKSLGGIEAMEGLRRKIEALSFDVEDIILQMRNIERTLLLDQEEMEKLEERLTDIFKLKEKYGKTFQEIVSYAEGARAKLAYLNTLATDIEGLEAEKGSLEKDVWARAQQLSAKRKKGAAGIEREIVHELEFLSMKGLKFEVMITDRGFVDRDGRDDVELMISTNPGEPLKPLRKVASGGELSRIMLAIKKVIGGEEEKTLIFDEVDAGIGGRVADMVGKRLNELARKQQVLCITHLPQIAAYGDHHFLVEKESGKERTKTSISELKGAIRVREIARMMGGERITEKTMERAEEMLSHDQESTR
ncbi:MAG TPA: DNA repair protein RecN [Syntrophorhabdaceae bacterium]|nr:DNA repair protein RecN [Syntrophorhabdaceae bacterium]